MCEFTLVEIMCITTSAVIYISALKEVATTMGQGLCEEVVIQCQGGKHLLLLWNSVWEYVYLEMVINRPVWQEEYCVLFNFVCSCQIILVKNTSF